MRLEWFDMIHEMRSAGWAVVTFSPGELLGADRQRFEERLDDLGYDLAGEMTPDAEWGE